MRYVGPILDDPVWAAGSWTPPPGDGPLVLVSMSSTFQNQAQSLQRVLDALATLPVRALVTTGPVLDPGELKASPGVTVLRSAPHSEVLRHASVVVTHGGHGTLVKAFAAGVPVVVVPHGRDQGDNAARVTWHGAGVTVPRTAAPAKMAGAIRRVLDDLAYRQAAARLGAELRHDAESGRLLAELEDLGADTDTGQTGSGGSRLAS